MGCWNYCIESIFRGHGFQWYG